MLDDKIKLRVFPGRKRSGTDRTSRRRDPARDSAGELREALQQDVQSDQSPGTNLRTLNLMDQYTKKLTSQITDAECQVFADIVKVNDTIEELDLPKNTKSSKKYKITIDESVETVEKAKTTTNIIVRFCTDEVTCLDEVHEECVVHLHEGGSEMKHILKDYKGQDVRSSGISANQNVVIVGERETMKIQAVPSVMKLLEKHT